MGKPPSHTQKEKKNKKREKKKNRQGQSSADFVGWVFASFSDVLLCTTISMSEAYVASYTMIKCMFVCTSKHLN